MSEQAYEWIEYKMADGVATITFNRAAVQQCARA